MNLKTGKVLTRHKVRVLPLPDVIRDHVVAMGVADGIKPATTFHTKKDGTLVNMDDVPITGVEGYPQNPTDIEHEDDDDDSYDSLSQDDESIGSFEEIDEDELKEIKDLATRPVENTVEDSVREQHQPIEQAQPTQDNRTMHPLRRSTRMRRQRKPHNVTHFSSGYSRAVNEIERRHDLEYKVNHLVTQCNKVNTLEYDSEMSQVLGKIFSFVQTYTLNKGIKKFGDRGYEAAYKEVEQLHKRMVFEPIDVNTLTPQERKRALESLIFLVEKRDGRIKARACANGSKQREWMAKGEAASPTVGLESVLLTATIEAHENRDVAVIDIPNAFVQTDFEGEMVVMKVRGQLAEILVSMAPEIYKPFVCRENNQMVVYLKVKKAIYGLIQSALLFYNKLRRDLESIGFKINPYDPCIANRIVNGKQHTVSWHVDDLKSSHVDSKINDDFIQWIRTMYEDVTPVKPSRGKKHDYLAMSFDYSTPGAVVICMKKYIEKMLQEFPYPNDIKGKAKTPAGEHLFIINDKGEYIGDEKAEVFHTTVAKALFLCKRSRLDIQLTVAFLCTRVQNPDQDDWKKLCRLLSYLKGTLDLKLTLEANDLSMSKWYADAAFAVHKDYKSHTGGIHTMGKGAIQSISTKQKLNTKSSTEAELVGADDVLGQLLWTRNFLEHQGYTSKETILYQDNTSAILLENNGMESSSKRTRHINIRYYFIKDRILAGDLKVKYCSTEDMIADYMSKPLQGKKFIKFRNLIMNIESNSPSSDEE